MRLRLSAAARGDLDSIWDYTAERWNEAQAERYIRQIGDAVSALSSGTARGRDASAVRAGYFRLPVGSHVISYRLAPKGDIEVIRILHQAMDVDRHL